MKYVLYLKNDKSQEAIHSITAKSLNEALDYFMEVKKLDLDKFNNIFAIKAVHGKK